METILNRKLEDEMQSAYLDYSMSVIVGRALPDARDGLKPVHRRVLFSMHELGLQHNKQHRKSARVVGDVLGKYHPHGDTAVYDTMVRMAQDFSLRYPLVDGQGNWGCFTKDTKVQLTDGRSLSFGELVEEHDQGKQNYTYTADEKGVIKIAKILDPRLTKRGAALVKITLDTGETIRCTPNHRFMLRTGEYKEARYLHKGESLMPLYMKLSEKADGFEEPLTGYTLIFQPTQEQWVFAHWLADAYNLENGVYTVQKGKIRHHKDFNKQNNAPENIERMQWGEHWRLHAELTKERHKFDAIYVQKLREGREAFWAKPESRKANSDRLAERNRNNWNDDTYSTRMRQLLSEATREYIRKHPEIREMLSRRASQTLERMWQDEKYRKLFHEKIAAANKKRITNNTGKKKFLAICKQALLETGTLNEPIYSVYRDIVYPYGCSPLWENAFPKYYEDKGSERLLADLCVNHTVAAVDAIPEMEDVYDLTIENTHNFSLAAGIFVHNSIDGDGAAAMRYTEAKLTRIAEELLEDIDKETVEWTDNFDATQKEPVVLPSRFPNLLVNGSSGIAVGMATNIPPHNIKEVCSAIAAVIDNGKISFNELLQHVTAPDFPTGARIIGRQGVVEAYKTGKGKITVRGTIEHESHKDRTRLVITAIPYQVNKSQLIEQIAETVRNKLIEGITDIRDESNKDGMRVVIELKKDAAPEVVERNLYSQTKLQQTFGIILLALVDNRPRVLTLRELIDVFIKHRQDIVRRRTQFELKKAEEKSHLLEGLIICLNNLDAVINLIKKSKEAKDAREALVSKYALSEIQAQAVLDMKLQRLTGLEQQSIRDEHTQLQKAIAEFKAILASAQRILEIIKKETADISARYSDKRRTIVEDAGADFVYEDLIEDEKTVITMSHAGYVKRLALDTYKEQRRGGIGVIGATTKEEDWVESLITANTHDTLLVFTSKGKVHWIKVYELSEQSRTAKGRHIANIINLSQGETVSAFVPVRDYTKGYLFFATRDGTVKKTSLSEYSRPRNGGIQAISLDKEDKLVNVIMTSGEDELVIVSRLGMAIRFSEKDVRPMGRSAGGVRGITLDKDDAVVSLMLSYPAAMILTVTELGFGKRTPVDDYRLIGRGGKGVITMNTEKAGAIVAARTVSETQGLILITQQGTVLRTKIEDISVQGRATQGVRVMKLRPGDKIVAAANTE